VKDLRENEVLKIMSYIPERKNLFDTMFDSAFSTPSFRSDSLMKTDIRKKDGYYNLDIELPGYKKEDIKISLYNGDLTVSASHTETNEEKDARGSMLRQERYSGTVSRTFYVGDAIRESDVKAAYENGVLTITVPSAEKKEAEEKKFISIL